MQDEDVSHGNDDRQIKCAFHLVQVVAHCHSTNHIYVLLCARNCRQRATFKAKKCRVAAHRTPSVRIYFCVANAGNLWAGKRSISDQFGTLRV
jgi:hypothetical protein